MKDRTRVRSVFRIVLFILPALTALLACDRTAQYPSDVISYFDQWKITLGDGSTHEDLLDYEHQDYFYTVHDEADWVVYKTPNKGGTTPNSSNTRSELRHRKDWTPETGGRLTGTLKVMQVSTTGDARVPGAFSAVIGQIHSGEGHENEPLKIVYKKFPGHEKGSVYWNYEINTAGDNSKRWDHSTAVWGYDWSVRGSAASSWPDEPEEGIELGEEFSYEVNVYQGIMYLSFKSEGHATVTFAKNLLDSDFKDRSAIPAQVLERYRSGRDGSERANAYAGELMYFKQGVYNQANPRTGSECYEGNLSLQYTNGSYAEVWFREATVGPAIDPEL